MAADLDTAYHALLAQPEVDPERVALLGHSMGSGVVMQAGVADAALYRATIAVSPTGADVSDVAPRNFFLMAGQLEAPFIANARELLVQAGGVNADFSGGVARDLLIVPNVEHISILFNPVSHRAALDWLDQTFGEQMPVRYQDMRIAWYGAHLLAWLLLLMAVAPVWRRQPERPFSVAQQPLAILDAQSTKLRPWHWLALIPAPFMATGVLYLLAQFTPITTFGGVQLAGPLAVWFLTTGIIWLIVGYEVRRNSF